MDSPTNLVAASRNIPPARRRLPPEQRRRALLDAGEEVFRTVPFEDVSMQNIALHAGVTRALLYHYFATKAELFGQIWARAHSELLASAPSDAPTARAWTDAKLEQYVGFYAANIPLLSVARFSPIADDPAVRRPVEEHFRVLVATLLDTTGGAPDSRRLAEVGFEGWITFVRDTALVALLDKRISVEEHHNLCMAAFDAAVGRYVDLNMPAPRPIASDTPRSD